MILTYICAGIAGGLLASTLHYHKEWQRLKSEYNKRCNELTDALGEVGRIKLLNEDIQTQNKSLEESIRDYKNLLSSGCRYIKWVERTIPYKNIYIPNGCIVVVGQSVRRSDLFFVIRSFYYDVNDTEDREFAIRCAEELIETIENA